MNEPYALVSPSYCLDSRDVLDLTREFGPYSGRYVYQYPSNWLQLLKEHIQQLQPIEQEKIKRLIKLGIETALLDVKAVYQEQIPWESNVRQIKRFEHVPIIVGSAIDPMGFKAWEDALQEICDTRRRSWHIGGSWIEYLNAIEPLLTKSPACYLVDRHFNPLDNDSSSFLISLLDRASRSSCYEVHLITRYKAIVENGVITKGISHSKIENDLQALYRETVPRNRKLICHFVEEDREGGKFLRMHNRYFLTAHGAIDFGKGFKLLTQAHKQILVHIVDKPAHEDLKSTYITGVARHCERLPIKEAVLRPKHVDSVVIASND